MILMSFVIMSCDNGAESIDTSAETTVETTVETTTVETSATTSAATSAETTANTSAETTAETTVETVEIDIPDGYQLFSDGYIAFVYPETWSKNDGSVTILSADNGNNITITYEAKTDYYENMSLTKFNSELKPTYEAMGMSISDISVRHDTNRNDVRIVRLSYTVTVNEVSMEQTAFILTSGDRTYSINVTETVVSVNNALTNNVYKSLAILKPTSADSSEENTGNTSGDANIPAGYKIFSDEYISFAHPAHWEKNEKELSVFMTNPNTGNSIQIDRERKTIYYDQMSVEQFNDELKPYYELSGIKILNVDIEYLSNSNGLSIAKFTMSARTPYAPMTQTLLVATVADRTHVISISEMEPEPELVNNIFNSLTALK